MLSPSTLSRKSCLGIAIALLVTALVSSTRNSCPDTMAPSDATAQSFKVCLMVEPSPFTYVSGYANRFQEMLRALEASGDEVEIITTDVHADNPPTLWHRYPVHHTCGVTIPRYRNVSISVDWKLQALRVLWRMRPDILHVSSPGLMVFPSIFYSRLLSIPLVMSYHTNLPSYIRNYFVYMRWLEHLAWWLVQFAHYFADLTLVTSPQMKDELQQHGIRRVDVWRKGINTERFHPRYRNDEMRIRMTEGHSEDFVILYVGRLGAEKRVIDLLPIMKSCPENTRLCIVGTGPQEDELKEAFENTNTLFMGVLHGEELSQAFASANVLILPSDTETLGFVVLESMASAVPVIGANAGGIPHLIHDGVTSFLVTPGNTSEYLARIEQLRSDENFRIKMGRLGRHEAEKWSWESSMGYLRNAQYKQAQENFQNRWFCLDRHKSKSEAKNK